MEEKFKVDVVQKVASGKLRREEAVKLLKCSERTVFRLQKRISEKGIVGVIHGH